MTPAQRHAGLARALLEQRALVYERAHQENPQRWSGQARQWAHVDTVHLNPETPHIKEPQHTQKNSLTHFTSGDNFLGSYRGKGNADTSPLMQREIKCSALIFFA